MGLREEIASFTDGNGLVAPNLVSKNTLSGSDNGPMFCSEYYVMLAKLGELTEQDKKDYEEKITRCITEKGMLCRVPVAQANGQEGPDDYYGVINGCKALGITSIPRKFLWAITKNFGFLDNMNTGKLSGNAFLGRQPQMIAAMVSAGFPSLWNPLHLLLRALYLPLYALTSIIIATSCMGRPVSDTDGRRLSWHLLQATKDTSLLCWLASKVWMNRLYGTYPDGMKGVAKIYYQGDHPFKKYWVTE